MSAKDFLTGVGCLFKFACVGSAVYVMGWILPEVHDPGKAAQYAVIALWLLLG